MKLSNFKKLKGASLFELMFFIVLFSILSIIAYPKYQDMMANFERFKTISLLNGLMSELRSESAMNRARIGVCGSADGVSCNSSAWSIGVLVFYDDKKHDRERQLDEKIRNYFKLNLNYGILNWKGAGANNIVFQQEYGIPRGANGSFFYCSHRVESARLYMSFMGHTREQKMKNC